MGKNTLRKNLMSEAIYNPFHRDYNHPRIRNDIKEMKEDEIKEEDLIIAYSSCLFNKYYKKAYNELDYYIKNTELTVSKLIECFMAISNRDCFITKQKMKNELGEETEINIRDINSFYVEAPVEGFEAINRSALCESGVSTINVILNHIKHCQEQIKENKKEKMEDYDHNQILSVFRYNNLRYELKDAYDDVVWNQGTIKLEDKKMYLKFQDEDRLKTNRVGDWRSDKLILEMIKSYCDIFKKYPKIQKSVLYHNRRLFINEVREESGYIKCCLDENMRDIAENTFGLIHMAAVNVFYQYVSTIKLKKLNELNLSEIIELYGILNEIIMKLEKKKTIEDDINGFGYKIKKNDLMQCLKEASTFSEKQIHAFMGLVSFDFEIDENSLNLYKKPIILYKDVYYLNSLLLKSPNTLFMMDEWLKEGGYNLTERGINFEKYLKDKLANAFDKKGIVHKVINKSKFYDNKKRYEEIDLIIELEKVIIVGEVKCIKYPMEPRDFHNMYNTLDKASNQIKRKVEFLGKNHEILKNEINGLGNKAIIEVIIINYPLFTGYSINGVPIIDDFSFENYFKMGEFRIYSSKAENESYIKKFYNNEEELYINMKSYFKTPLVISEELKKVRIKNSLILPKECPIEIYKECAVMGEDRII